MRFKSQQSAGKRWLLTQRGDDLHKSVSGGVTDVKPLPNEESLQHGATQISDVFSHSLIFYP